MYENQGTAVSPSLRTVRPSDLSQNQTRPATPLNEVRQVLLDAGQRLESLYHSAMTVADGLSGCVPSPGAPTGRIEEKHDGLVTEIHAIAVSLHARIELVEIQLQRLGRI